jgi:hypothetical protein
MPGQLTANSDVWWPSLQRIHSYVKLRKITFSIHGVTDNSCWILYHFPRAAIENYRTLHDLRQQKTFFHSLEAKNLKLRCQQALPLWRCWEDGSWWSESLAHSYITHGNMALFCVWSCVPCVALRTAVIRFGTHSYTYNFVLEWNPNHRYWGWTSAYLFGRHNSTHNRWEL